MEGGGTSGQAAAGGGGAGARAAAFPAEPFLFPAVDLTRALVLALHDGAPVGRRSALCESKVTQSH